MIRDVMVLLDGDAPDPDLTARYPIALAALHKAYLTIAVLSERLFLTAPFNPLRPFFPIGRAMMRMRSGCMRYKSRWTMLL
ncbi:hypothetical protein [Sphingomonas sp. MMS24-J13]|uniref:hypothetical protein n=1 Tax=Sphingomonas sp. MMS24-J13 TaxID=3238686 RepID=UPI00384F6C69